MPKHSSKPKFLSESKSGKVIRFSIRYKKRVTSISIKSYIIALYLSLNGVKKEGREFMRETIQSFLKDMDHKRSNKGLSEAINIKLLDDLLGKKDRKLFWKHLARMSKD